MLPQRVERLLLQGEKILLKEVVQLEEVTTLRTPIKCFQLNQLPCFWCQHRHNEINLVERPMFNPISRLSISFLRS
jgi:hypothetical protein